MTKRLNQKFSSVSWDICIAKLVQGLKRLKYWDDYIRNELLKIVYDFDYEERILNWIQVC